MADVLYIHGMGGGSDSRIPSILNDVFASESITIITRTYSFDPKEAELQISAWVKELEPALVIGESLGSLQAMKISGIPHIYVSPALNAPLYFEVMAWLTLIPGISWLFGQIYKPREGDRQPLDFRFGILRKYRRHRQEAFASAAGNGNGISFAFFGSRDHYRRSGVVSIATWKKHFGSSYDIYDGTHFMEEEFVRGMLADKVREYLSITV